MKRTLAILCGVVVVFALVGTATAVEIKLTLGENAFADGVSQKTYLFPDFSDALAGQVIKSAHIRGTWGDRLVNTSAHNSLFVNSVPVANSKDDASANSDAFFTGNVEWEHSFGDEELSILKGGKAELLAMQTAFPVEGNVRLGETTLTINTAAVPEPCAMILVGSGLLALVALKRKMQRKSLVS